MMNNLKFKTLFLMLIASAFIMTNAVGIALLLAQSDNRTNVSDQKIDIDKKVNIVFSLQDPLKDFDTVFDQKYGHLRQYYMRWNNFDINNNTMNPTEIDHYLKLSIDNSLPANVTIYKGEPAMYAYKIILNDQKLYNNYDNIKLAMKTMYTGIIDDEVLSWETIDGQVAKMPSIPFFDFCLWVLEKYKNTDHFNNNEIGICLSCEVMYLIGLDFFPKEEQYIRKHVFPVLKKRIEENEFNPLVLKTLYWYEKDEKYLSKAVEVAKTYPVFFSTWGNDYESYTRKIRITIDDLNIEPYVKKLLNSGYINEASQYDAFVYLYNIGKITEYINYIFDIIDNRRYNAPPSLGKYIDLLLKIKDTRILQYFIKNEKNRLFIPYKGEIDAYILKSQHLKENK